jgi:hypothetical protein
MPSTSTLDEIVTLVVLPIACTKQIDDGKYSKQTYPIS